jgi:site-specific DNA recombinase
MLPFYAYIRVSTPKQGEGVSLKEQRYIIEAFAKRNNLVISEWFEEEETAAKQGREIFERLLAALRRRKAQGVIIHKIDRSIRNLADWVELERLVDLGVDVYFANENLDLRSRGGRLAADIQAVVASDYVRNLKEEVKKGLEGRLKQGFFPFQAPLGYRNHGKAKPKTICPKSGWLVRKAFELYATGDYSLDSLRIELTRLGLRNKWGNVLHKNGVAHILTTPFYYGLMHIKSTNETYPGIHEPLISKELFDRVQALLRRRTNVKAGVKRQYLLQRMIKCSGCGRGLYAERQKGHVYYRCQSKTCRKTSLHEDAIVHRVAREIGYMNLTDEKLAALVELFRVHISELRSEREDRGKSLQLNLAQAKERLERLTDAYLDRAIDRDTFESRKTALHNEIIEGGEKLGRLRDEDAQFEQKEQHFLELLKKLRMLGNLENPAEKRDVLKSTISNVTVLGKNVEIDWDTPFQLMVSEQTVSYGGPQRDDSRTFREEGDLRHVICKVLACAKSDDHLNRQMPPQGR